MERLLPITTKVGDFFDLLYEGMTKKIEIKGIKYNYTDKYREVKPLIINAETSYFIAAMNNKLSEIESITNIGDLTTKDMVYLYENKLLDKTKGRHIYDEIRSLPSNSRCSFCGVRVVATLDHYLPKSKYPLYAVTPYNLIPSCTDCNGLKMGEIINSELDLLLNPYFDDVQSEQWLFCDIEYRFGGWIPKYYTKEIPVFTEMQNKRIANHFKVLELDTFFGIHGVNVIEIYIDNWIEFWNNEEFESLKEEFDKQEKVFSSKEKSINSWERALYQGLYNFVHDYSISRDQSLLI